MSLLTITAISINRLLALLLGLRYRQVVTLKRTYVAVTILWVFSIVPGTITYQVNPFTTSWWGNIGSLLCLVTSTSSYTKIFLTLRHDHIQPQEYVSQAKSPQATAPLNMDRYTVHTQYPVHYGYK